MPRRVTLLVPALLTLLLGLGVDAHASRSPTRRETREIREDAKLYLTGGDWRVSGIRVSTVNGHYAKAAVKQGQQGPAGEMILHLRHGIWHEAFLGTDEFCSAPVPKRVLDDLGFRC
ncbi:MAG TPA: hypothetical protein VES65_03805 [Solirubrobacteraceae bacterium]|nr:hypothetical protein [Solirubrobacteraceae bacterium]